MWAMPLDRESIKPGSSTLVSGTVSEDPGKSTRTGALQRREKSVQRDGESHAPTNPDVVMPIAEQGVASGGAEVPFRDQMESGFGTSFEDVRVHTGGAAAEASSAIGADAYTMGSSIAFAVEPTPGLVAHELAHVVQQRGGAGPSEGVGTAGDSFEREADHAAEKVASGGQSDIVDRYGVGNFDGVLQRKAVQRYESGEHAMLGCGAGYPAGGDGDLVLPSGASIYMGELVAFGDFYADMKQLQAAPRQEVEALAGVCRLEAIWVKARMVAAKLAGNPVQHQVAPNAPGGNAVPGGNGGNAPGSGTPTGGKPSAGHLAGLPKLESDDGGEEANKIWLELQGGKTLRDIRNQIYNQFKPAWDIFGIILPKDSHPETGMAMVKATVGRRRFRGDNNSMGKQDDPNLANEPNKDAKDPGHMGGDYLDLAQNNLSHFSTDNWENWKQMHEEAAKAHAKPGATENDKKMAIAADTMGSHFLTDRFSTGHFVDKAELMHYATQMMLDQAKKHGKKGANAHEILKNQMQDAVKACFDDGAVRSAWKEGVEAARKEGVLNDNEAWALALAVDAATGTIAEKLVGVIMDMPWREFDPTAKVATGGAARNDGDNSVNRSIADPSRGATKDNPDKGDYHLGAGNLAALQVHDALNIIGFTVKNGNNDQWRIQGDNKLNAETLTIANNAVKMSQDGVRRGDPNTDEIKKLMPSEGYIDPAWVSDFFNGEWKTSDFDPKRLSKLMGTVKTAKIPLGVDGGHKGVSKEMTDVCHQLMETLFLLPDGASKADDPNNTGLNISMLKAFLIRRLEEMVPMAYLSTSAADLPQQALELYAPKNEAGGTLPRSANDFVWNGNELAFNLNVTGCKAGTYTLKARCFNKDMGFDRDARGQVYGRGNGDPSGGALRRTIGTAGGITNGGMTDTDEEYTSLDFQVTVADSPDANAKVITASKITVPKQGGLFTDNGDRYVLIHGDPDGNCPIGRSNTKSEDAPGNPSVAGELPKVTGDDKQAVQKPLKIKSGFKDGAIGWQGATVMFALECEDAPIADVNATVYIKTMDWDIIGKDAQVGTPQAVPVKFFANNTQSQIVLFTPAEDDPNDTYIVVYRDAALDEEIGRSRTQGWNKDNKVPNLVSGKKLAKSASGAQWNGNKLTFAVEPEDADPVYVIFRDKDWGFDYDAGGNKISGASNEDEMIGGVHTAQVTNGRASVVGPDDGDAYGIVYSDPGCTKPLTRSGTKS